MKRDSRSEDLTRKLPRTDSEKISLILTTVQNLETRVDRLEVRFDGLEKKVDERLYDTRPIWEKVVADIAQLQEGQNQIKTSIRDIFFQMSAVGDTMRMIQGSHKDFDIRIRELERQQHKPTNSST